MRVRLVIAALAVALLAVTAPPASGQSDDLAATLQQVVADGDIAGAVAVRDDSVDGHRDTVAYAGRPDLRIAAPWLPDTHVRAASVTKTFVAATILQLAEERRVELDASVDTYLPGLLRGPGIDGTAITVRHLLRHQSGLPEYPDADPAAPATPREILSRALALPGQAPGGDVAVYTNTNYIVAGLLIEAVSGRPAAEEITRRVVVPLGLKHTYFPVAGDRGLRAPMAHGYELVDGVRRDVSAQEPAEEYMAGSLISTAEDMAAFVTALLGGRVIRTEQLTQMMDTVPLPGLGPGFAYGLGLMRIDLPCGVTVWGHAGDVAGYHTVVAKAIDSPALSATFTQGRPDPGSLAEDPRLPLVASVFCSA